MKMNLSLRERAKMVSQERLFAEFDAPLEEVTNSPLLVYWPVKQDCLHH